MPYPSKYADCIGILHILSPARVIIEARSRRLKSHLELCGYVGQFIQCAEVGQI